MTPSSPRDRSVAGGQDARRAHSGGFSLMEVLGVLLLMALVLAGLLPLLSAGQKTYDDARRREEMMRAGRTALDKILRELRAADAFRALATNTIQYTFDWGDSTGAEPTAEFIRNTGTNNIEYRWKDDYNYRKQITVTAVTAVAVDFAVSVAFDHAALVTAGKSLASGNDVRVRYWDGSKYVELDRFKDPTTAWNTTTTKIWFRLQTALSAGASNNNYYLYYGNLQAGLPPANPDNIFLDYEDGTTLDGWTRRDTNTGTYTTSVSDGFVTTIPSSGGSDGYREMSKNVAHSNVEIFYGFRVGSTSASDGYGTCMGARLSDTGAGYRLVPGQSTNSKIQLAKLSAWAGSITSLQTASLTLTSNTDYYGRFSLVGSSLNGKAWKVGTAEPGWQVTKTDSTYASGNHWDICDQLKRPEDHRHRTMILRPDVTTEPTTTLGAETSGSRSDALVALAGPFRSMTVVCYDDTGASVSCASPQSVRAVQVTLVVMDPDGLIPDITLTGRVYRRAP